MAPPQRRDRQPDVGGDYPPDEFDVEYSPGERRGAHRTATPPVVEVLPWLVAAVLVVAVVVTVISVLTGGGEEPTAGGPPTTPASGTSTSAPPASTTSPPATTTTAPPSTPSATPDRTQPVVVLNGTGASGLAGRVRDQLTALGWTVSSIGNAEDTPVATSTVRFASEELRASAEALAADVGATAELDEGAGSPLVVVVGEDFSQ